MSDNQPLPYEVRERAAIIEFDGNLPRKEAERLAMEAYRKEQRCSK